MEQTQFTAVTVSAVIPGNEVEAKELLDKLLAQIVNQCPGVQIVTEEVKQSAAHLKLSSFRSDEVSLKLCSVLGYSSRVSTLGDVAKLTEKALRTIIENSPMCGGEDEEGLVTETKQLLSRHGLSLS